jgi:hypothetical protein
MQVYKPKTKEQFEARWGKKKEADLAEEEDCTTTPV